MPKIHPTAIVDPGAKIAADVEIGPYCIVEADVELGAGTVLRSHVVIRRYTTMGAGNFVDSGAVLGGEPQDYKFDPRTVSYLRIGDRNVFRENVTISRATGENAETRVGSDTYWMGNSHAGHNVTVDDGAVLVNNAGIAGHAHVGRKAILSGGSVVHQYCWIGERTMSQGNAGASMHVPPYCMFSGVNNIASLNLVGLRRAEELTDADRRQVKDAFRLLYRAKLTPAEALKKMDAHADWGPAAAKFRDFIRKALAAKPPYNRGIMTFGRS